MMSICRFVIAAVAPAQPNVTVKGYASCEEIQLQAAEARRGHRQHSARDHLRAPTEAIHERLRARTR